MSIGVFSSAMHNDFAPPAEVSPMSFQLYLAFVAACVALALLPGPVVTLLIANGLRHGTRAALINCAGAQTGLAIVIGIVAVGLTSLMATMGYLPAPPT
jgi:threonine/homoserine/homoserine lactone efflux protein